MATRINTKKQYERYLKSPEWKGKRKEALIAAGYACQICNRLADSSCKLNAHHRSYDRLQTDDELKDIIIVCQFCHLRIHEN